MASEAWEVVLRFEDVPDKDTLNDWVWRMRDAGRKAGVPFPDYKESRRIQDGAT